LERKALLSDLRAKPLELRQVPAKYLRLGLKPRHRRAQEESAADRVFWRHRAERQRLRRITREARERGQKLGLMRAVASERRGFRGLVRAQALELALELRHRGLMCLRLLGSLHTIRAEVCELLSERIGSLLELLLLRAALVELLLDGFELLLRLLF